MVRGLQLTVRAHDDGTNHGYVEHEADGLQVRAAVDKIARPGCGFSRGILLSHLMAAVPDDNAVQPKDQIC